MNRVGSTGIFFLVTGNAVQVSKLVINKQETKKNPTGRFDCDFRE